MFSWFRQNYCMLCQSPSPQALCSGCLHDIDYVQREHACLRCAAPRQPQHEYCDRCQRKPLPFAAMWSSTYFQPPVSAIIHEWKHSKNNALVAALQQIMLHNPPAWLPETPIDAVLPMPISRKRLWQRGFHQTEELVQGIVGDLPILPRHAVTRDHRVAQSQLNYAMRRQNIRHVFDVNIDVCDQHILLIDDVFTTGATLTELARELHEAGAMAVSVWTLSRALLK